MRGKTLAGSLSPENHLQKDEKGNPQAEAFLEKEFLHRNYAGDAGEVQE